MSNATSPVNSNAFQVGQRVMVGQYPGVIIREYIEGMWEVKLPGGMAVKPACDIHPA